MCQGPRMPRTSAVSQNLAVWPQCCQGTAIHDTESPLHPPWMNFLSTFFSPSHARANTMDAHCMRTLSSGTGRNTHQGS